jgi:hypothetical protein
VFDKTKNEFCIKDFLMLYNTPMNAKYSIDRMYCMDSSILLKFGLLIYFRGANTVKRGALIKNA